MSRSEVLCSTHHGTLDVDPFASAQCHERLRSAPRRPAGTACWWSIRRISRRIPTLRWPWRRVSPQRLGLGTGVTNCATRHPAVSASAAAAVQDVSNGRMVLGIGRGDSALAHLGRAPARFAEFERYVDVLQRYLRGEAVPFSDLRMDDSVALPVASLDLADHPSDSRIRWIKPDGLKKVPVEVAATGPAGNRHGGTAGRSGDVHPGRGFGAYHLGHRDGARAARHECRAGPRVGEVRGVCECGLSPRPRHGSCVGARRIDDVRTFFGHARFGCGARSARPSARP